MPFTPKFVDMVRNVTSSTGTGAVSPGSAVSGFTSLSDAIATGEQFYYCIQGVDKPAEREVGRGTMQANGTIARQPISGNATNFTTGTKTIALIAAAEWFAKLEAGGASGTSSSIVAGLTELAALPTASGATALLTAKGREGMFVFDTSNLSSKVSADPRKAITVAPAVAQSGASGAWVRKFDGPINVRWFGVAADFVTDDLPAINAALALIGPTGGTLYLPAGRYYCASTINVHYGISLAGDGSNQGANGTLIRFGNNCNGIVFNYGTTLGDTSVADVGHNATGASLTGVQLWGGNVNVDGAGNVTTYGAGDSITGHGVRIRTTFVYLADVFCAFFGGDGFNIDCTAGTGGSTGGNANDFYLERCQAIYNARYGYLVNGTDANAGTINTCSAISNAGCGFLEYSFLGNSYIQCHARDNGANNPVISGGQTGHASYGGQIYYVIASKTAQASTTVPGTDPTVWVQANYLGVGRAWTSGLTWLVPGAYATNPGNANATNVFMGCYAEGAQAPVQAEAPALFLGGLLSEVGFHPGSTAGRIKGDRAGISSGCFTAFTPNDSARVTIVGPATGITDPSNIIYTTDGTSTWHFGYDGTGLAFSRDGSGTPARISADGIAVGPGQSLLLYPGATPAVISDGRIWYDSAAAKFKKRQNGATSDLDTVGGVPAVSVTAQAGAAYTAEIGDAGNVLRFTSATAATFTIPPNSAVAFPVGSAIEFEQAGAGAVTVAAGAGVTINSRGGDLILAGQYAVAALRKVAADTWTLTGDL